MSRETKIMGKTKYTSLMYKAKKRKHKKWNRLLWKKEEATN